MTSRLRFGVAFPSLFALHVGPAPETGPQDGERPLRFDDRDRRRLVFASALTVAALPAVWLVNRDDDTSTRPNVAAVGAAVADAAVPVTRVTLDPMGDVNPQYLDAPAPATAPALTLSAPVVGDGDGVAVAAVTAIFRRSIGDAETCIYSGVPDGSQIVVVNVANDRSVECWTTLRPIDEPQRELVMSAAAFAAIADPTAAPIHVEIRLR